MFCCVCIFIFWSTPSHTSLIHFCVAELNTPGASIVPSLGCEAPPQQGHKVLEAGTRYPYNENLQNYPIQLILKEFLSILDF